MLKPHLLLAASALLFCGSASAHFTILEPAPASTSTDGGKGPPPCGPSMDSGAVTEAQGGHPLTIQVSEYVFHPGFYRVALTLDSLDALPSDNAVKDKQGNDLAPDSNGLSYAAEYQLTPQFPVLADGLWQHDMEEPTHQADVMLPNVTCDKCVLQVIEFMSNHEASFFYHHCAVLKITADPALPVFDPSSTAAGGAPSTAWSSGSVDAGGGGGGSDAGGTAGASGMAGTSSGNAASSGASSGGSSSGGGGGLSNGGSFGAAGAATAAGTTSSLAGSSSAGANTHDSSGDSGGCSLSAARSRGGLSALLAALALLGSGLRRRQRRARA